MTEIRVLVFGGRDFDNWAKLDEVLSNFFYRDHPSKVPVLIEGGAIGVDFLARVWAKHHGFDFEEYPAQWKKHGKAAGAIRNQQMIDEGYPDFAIGFPGGTGTADMIRRLKKNNIKLIEVEE